MRREVAVWAICVMALLPTLGLGQEPARSILPALSEDEVLEALISGEIDYDQYAQLMELVQFGIDSTDIFLLDEIPFVSLNFADLLSGHRVRGHGKSTHAAVDSSGPGRSSLSYSYYSTLGEEPQFRYQSAGVVRVDPDWKGTFKLRRETSGRERLVERSVEYSDDSGLVRKLAVGSVKVKYGLGSIIGYRGKVLGFSGRLGGESAAFPDYGGFNGVAVETREGKHRINGLVSYNRDVAYELTTTAVEVSTSDRTVDPSVIAVVNRVRNRATGQSDYDIKGGVDVAYRYKAGNGTIEYCAQIGARDDFGTLLIEGIHRHSGLRVQYAGWMYGEDYLDLAGGGRASDIRTRDSLPESGLSFSDKRTGQHGVMLNLSASLDSVHSVSGGVILAGRNSDSTKLQFQGAVERRFRSKFKARLDYQHTVKHQKKADTDGETYTRRCRAEVRFECSRISFRSYIGYSSTTTYGDYVSLFTDLKAPLGSGAQIEFWSNLARVAKGRVDYWYLYARLRQELFNGLVIATKVQHRYQRTGSARVVNAVSLELNAGW